MFNCSIFTRLVHQFAAPHWPNQTSFSSLQDRHQPLVFASLGIGGIARSRSRCAVMHIGAMCVGAVTMRLHVPLSPSRTAGVIPNVVTVPQAPLGRLRVLRFDVFDFRPGCAFWQCIRCHVLFCFCSLRHVCLVSSDSVYNRFSIQVVTFRHPSLGNSVFSCIFHVFDYCLGFRYAGTSALHFVLKRSLISSVMVVVRLLLSCIFGRAFNPV